MALLKRRPGLFVLPGTILRDAKRVSPRRILATDLHRDLGGAKDGLGGAGILDELVKEAILHPKRLGCQGC